MQSYKSKVLNLYSPDEAHHFRIVPSDVDVQITHDGGVLPISFPLLYTQGVDVHEKMFENAEGIASESLRAINAESAIQSNLSAEIARAQEAESETQAALDAEIARLSNQEAFEAGELAAEVANRVAGDNVLQNALNNETKARTAADTQHTTDISNESLRATSEEQRIEAKFDAYKSSNDFKVDAGDAKHYAYELYANQRMTDIENKSTSDGTANSDALATESKTRADEVSRLDGRIDNVISNIDPAALDSLSEIVNKFTNDGVYYADRLTALEAVVAALVEQLN